MSEEWKARAERARQFFRTLGKPEGETLKDIAARKTNEAIGKRPDFRPRHGIDWAYDLPSGDYKKLADWDFKWDFFFVTECERLMAFKDEQMSREMPKTFASASEDSWEQGRD